jgi:predicted Zn-dependent protease
MPTPLENFLAMLEKGRDAPLLRFSIGNEYMKQGDAVNAAIHLREAVVQDANYSAAWKLLGKALADSHALADALAAYRQGIVVADARGDKQAAKEMTVFARRIEKQIAGEIV